jgi:hypothetical protein
MVDHALVEDENVEVKSTKRLNPSVVILFIIILCLPCIAWGQAASRSAQRAPKVDAVAAAANDVSTAYETNRIVPFEFDGDVRELRQVPLDHQRLRPHRRLLPGPPSMKSKAPVAKLQSAEVSIPLAPMPSAIQNFAGLSFADTCDGGQCGAGWPPDPNGDVGLSHYILAVNDAYAIYDKTGTLLASFTENQLWSTGGANPCNGDSLGDPIVLYDPLADRWILTHIAFAFSGNDPVSPFYQCIAASKTSDPVAGGWWLYPVRMDPGGTGLPPVGALNDYPKFGIWTDCLYMAANGFHEPGDNFIGTIFASFSRSDLYSGGPLTFALGFIMNFINAPSPFTMIPSNLRGVLPGQLPAPGTPNYFVSESTTLFSFEVRKFTAGANCGGGGTLGAATNVSQTSYTGFPGVEVPQPNTTNLLDAIGDRLMQKVQYRKVGSSESLWVVHTVQNIGSTVRPQWAEIDVTGATVDTTPVQQQIYAPDTTLHRWMGSLAVDNQGNMALGYSTSNGVAPNFPSIAYSGRLASDPLNTLPQSEVQLVAGAGSQTNTCGGDPCDRWGDYSAMSVDPVDDCTFWYTNQYYSSQENGTSGNWQTRIGSFMFPSCTPPVVVPPLVIGAASLPDGELHVVYNGNLLITGGAPPYNVVVVVGSLPLGLSVNSNGIISGNPGKASGKKIKSFTVRVTDSLGSVVSKSFTIKILGPVAIKTKKLPKGPAGQAYSDALTATGGKPSYNWSVAAGSLPAGLSLNPSTGAITGTPAGAGVFGVTFRVVDALGGTAQRTYTITIN